MYKDEIKALIQNLPFKVDTDIEIAGRPPNIASSSFLTNKQQGDWAEKIVRTAINQNFSDYFAVGYGHSSSISAGDEQFSDFYKRYQNELNKIGKKPDLLIFRRRDFGNTQPDLENDGHVKKAIAALEVRSSSFLVEKYDGFMGGKRGNAISECTRLLQSILSEPYNSLLKNKNENIYGMLRDATPSTFHDLDFRLPSWSVTEELRELKSLLRELKNNIKILHGRDFLSVTPKMEDLALVNRWIQNYGVKHHYLQVFFDKAYVIPFKKILKLVSNHQNEESFFSIERDVKNQQKTTIKINVKIGSEVIGRIDMPDHASEMKELDRGRLLFYVKFEGGKGYLDKEVFLEDVINA